ncbi:hypothetical protein IJJ97_04400 [bacterium]|nr:hypothetical protein [bacterium]
MRFRLEDQGLDKNWIDFIVDSFFAPLGWKPPKDEEETSQAQPQQTQNQQTQNQQTQKQQTQNENKELFVVFFLVVGLFILLVILGDSNKSVTYSTIETANVGDYIKFGNYPKTSNGDIQPIEWQVLAKEGNKILVISRYGLDARRFDSSSNKWANSEIFKWLNGDFYNKAFTDQ